MKRRANKIEEQKGVNAARQFFESNGCVFQTVDTGNDYGKDAYVDLAAGEYITGLCAALQIKGGVSYRRADGSYFIPLNRHRKIWQESTVPILGLVHDPDDELIRWRSISDFVHQPQNAAASRIPIPRDAVLDVDVLHSGLRSTVLATSGIVRHPLVQALSEESVVSESAILDCFAVGRSEARIFVGLRYLLRALHGEAVRAYIYVLTHLTPHPDIFCQKDNWISTEVKQVVQPHLRWAPDEILQLLQAVIFEEFERGDIGQSLHMLLIQDPQIVSKMIFVAIQAAKSDEVAANLALYLHLHWLGESAPEHFVGLLSSHPELAALSDIPEITQQLQDHGYLVLF